MERKYQSEILGVIHQDAVEKYKIGAISENRMREYDRECLVPKASSIISTMEQANAYAVEV